MTEEIKMTANIKRQNSSSIDLVEISQAVVVIHGMGEQAPMSTIRGFVENILEKKSDGIQFFSKPDTVSGTYESRILQNRERPRTHFYEYYWAHKAQGTKFYHIWYWVKILLIRKRKDIPKHLLGLWYLCIVVSLAAIALFIRGAFNHYDNGDWQNQYYGFFLVISSASVAIQAWILNYIGDVARYLSPVPENIHMREKIKKDGIELLKKLHEVGYKRIIVVGHSLGGIVAYDLLRFLWQEYYREYSKPKTGTRKALKKVEELATVLHESQDELTLLKYKNAQKELLLEIQSMGNPWRITDLITIGAPLAHAQLLLAKNLGEFDQRKDQRELPINPPISDRKDRDYSFSYESWVEIAGVKNFEVIHSAGHFAFTRWTNLFVPVKKMLFGDIVGGPLQKILGVGIHDVPVKVRGKLKNYNLGKAHTSYWDTSNIFENLPSDDSIKALIKNLDLSYFKGDEILDFDSEHFISASGFEEPVTYKELVDGNFSQLPSEEGVYVIVPPEDYEPEFLIRDDTETFSFNSLDKAENKWIENSSVIYIGHGSDLKKFIKNDVVFGMKGILKDGRIKNIGYPIWQLADKGKKDFRIYWKKSSSAKDIKNNLLKQYKDSHLNQYPYANSKK